MPASNDDVTTRQNSSVYSDFATIPFPVSPSRKVTASNKDIVQDFMDLSFSLESGRNLLVFTRFEGPISIRLTGKVPQSLPSELNRLIHRLQDEAKLDIYYTSAEYANVNVHAVSRRQIQRTLPMAACFVAQNVVDLEDFKPLAKPQKPVGLHKRNGGWCLYLFHPMPAHRKYATVYTKNLPKVWAR